MIDILKLNAEIEEMIKNQDAEVKSMKKETADNQKKNLREFAEFIYPYVEAQKEIMPNGDLVIKEIYLDGLEFEKDYGYSRTASIVIRTDKNGIVPIPVSYYGDDDDYWFHIKDFDKCAIQKNGNIAKTWFDGSVSNDYNAYNMIVPFCKVVLKNRIEIEEDLRKQLLDMVRRKAERANRRYEEAQEALRESEKTA